MSAFYQKMQGVSLKLINRFGGTCQILSYDEDNNETIIGTTNAVAGTITNENRINTLDEQPDGLIYIPNQSFIPDITHYVRWNNIVYKVVYVQIYKPATEAVLYGLFIRV